jgi:type II secretion system protein I
MRVPRANGFTLLEAVAALAVAAIALLSLLQLQLVSMRTADKAEGLTQAVFLAQEKIAETISAGYPPLGVKSGSTRAQGDQFDWQIEVTEAHLPPFTAAGSASSSSRPTLRSERLRQLSVEVSWQKGPGVNHVSLTTFVAENQDHAG